MKKSRLAALAAFAMFAAVECSAAVPTWTQFSIGYYRTGGPALIEYWIDAYDTDNDITNLTTTIFDEWAEYRGSFGSTGNGAHRTSHGYVYCYDCFAPCDITVSEISDTYYFFTEVEY
jgi:hypothetical protein